MPTLKSQEITDRDTVPAIKRDVSQLSGRERVASGFMDASASAAAGDILLLTTLPARAKVKSILLYNDTGEGTTTVDVGLYDRPVGANDPPESTTGSKGAYRTAVSLSSVNVDTPIDCSFQEAAGGRKITDMDKRVWENAGLTKEPNTNPDDARGDFTLALTTNVGGLTGNLAWQVTYSID